MTESVLLDEVNRRLIEQLQRDGRLSYAALAKAVGLSEAAVRQRVQRMIDNDVLRIVAITDPHTLGYARQAMVGLKVTGDLRAIADQLAALPGVHRVVICAGGYDILAEVTCTDDGHLLALLNEQVRTIPGVASAETFVYLQRTRESYAWGT